MVMKNMKLTGNKKPLGSFAAEAAQPEGAVLQAILAGSDQLSNKSTRGGDSSRVRLKAKKSKARASIIGLPSLEFRSPRKVNRVTV